MIYQSQVVHACVIYDSLLGMIAWTKLDEFSENFRKGGGVISNPKNFVAVFSEILGQ